MKSLKRLQSDARAAQRRLSSLVAQAEMERLRLQELEAQIQLIQRGAWLFLIPSRLVDAGPDDLKALRAYAEATLASKGESK